MKCWVLAGPTAAGKTEVALALARSDEALEIVSCDSMQVYRGMNIGTAKPTPTELRSVIHHMVDIVEPNEDFSVGRYVEAARRAIEKVKAAGRRPLIVGGTALYLKALLWGLFEGPPADAEMRKNLKAVAEMQGPEALYDRLKDVDPESAGRLHANDLLRVIRALEVFALTGRPISKWQRQFDAEPAVDFVMVGLEWPRQILYRRIEERVRSMVRRGFVDEVKRLAEEPGFGPQARQALGYRQMLSHLEGGMSLEEAVKDSIKRTRRFAKHQMTWLKHFPELHWIKCDESRSVTDIVGEASNIFVEYS